MEHFALWLVLPEFELHKGRDISGASPCLILWPIYEKLVVIFISRRRRRPGDGYIATPPICPPVTFSFRTVTQKRIAVFSQNFASTCTKSWGCAVLFLILMSSAHPR